MVLTQQTVLRARFHAFLSHEQSQNSEVKADTFKLSLSNNATDIILFWCIFCFVLFQQQISAGASETSFTLNKPWPNLGGRRIHPGQLSLLPRLCPSLDTLGSLLTLTACIVSPLKMFSSHYFKLCFMRGMIVLKKTFYSVFHNCSPWCAAALSPWSVSICLFSAVRLSRSLSQQPVSCKLPAVSANCCPAAASRSCSCCSPSTGQSETQHDHSYWLSKRRWLCKFAD